MEHLAELFGWQRPADPDPLSSASPSPSTPQPPPSASDTAVLVIFFDDIKGSTAMKEDMASSWNEQAFQAVRREHDLLLEEVVSRDGAGHIIKSTGDGVLAVFLSPSVAVERALEIQERLHGHRHLSVRIGMDMGEVQVEQAGEGIRDVFGRHVDWAARAMAMGDGGHICVTRAVYTDAFSWITKGRIAWKEHGAYRMKPGEPPLELFEPYNANITQPLPSLQGDRVVGPTAATAAPAVPAAPPLRVVTSSEPVAEDGRAFAEHGAGIMYWFKPPLGEVCHPDGFRHFLEPALENPRVTKVRFILDGSAHTIRRLWTQRVFPLVQAWAAGEKRKFRLYQREGGGNYVEESAARKSIQWTFQDLSGEHGCFKLFVDDPEAGLHAGPIAQIVLSTLPRNVRFTDGTLDTVRIPEAVFTVTEKEGAALLHALAGVANQLDSLFP